MNAPQAPAMVEATTMSEGGGLDGLFAEGSGNEAQRDFQLRLGVTTGQCLLFAPGLLLGEIAKRVAAHQDTA